MRPAPRVDLLREVGLLLKDELGVAGDAGLGRGGERGGARGKRKTRRGATHRRFRGEPEGLVEGVGVQRLGAAHDGRHGLDGRADDVVMRLLGRERVAAGLAVRAQQKAALVLGIEFLLDERRPQPPRRAHLGNLHVEIHADAPEEREARRHGVHVEAGLDGGPAVLEPVGHGEAQLERGVGAGLVHVVAGDGDGVELGHVGRRVAEDVADGAQARVGGVDVGVADHELFEDVILDCACELLLCHPGLLRRHDKESHDGEYGAVHGHRHGDPG